MIQGDMAVYEAEDTEKSGLAKSNFLARMNHEMRTPLNAIIGMCTIANASDNIEKITGCLAKINEASIHLLGMINDVLDIAKIEAGSLQLGSAEFNPAQMLKKSSEKIRFTMDAKKQNLILNIDPDLPENIVSDEQRLSQVLDNLLSNAVKFTPPEGTITLSVKSIKRAAGSTCTLEVEVSDTGIGVSEEDQEKIFALFEQADGGTDRKYGGSGLGLHISSSIVRLMGGKIRLDSVPGKGSAFSFGITVEQGGTPAEKTAGAPGEIGQKAKFAGFSILLAEDVEINREIVTALLEDTGIAIDCAENGLQAVEMFKSSPAKYSLILMDIHMPEMDGFEATRQIRAHEAGGTTGFPGSIPIVAMTANVFKEDVDKCLAAGMTSHLGKPVDFAELMKELERYLRPGC
jgi:CheY-like chemotaxis protein